MEDDYHIALRYRRALGLRLLALPHVVNWCIQCCIIFCFPGAHHGKLTTQTLRFIIGPTQTSNSQVLSDLPTWALKYHGCERPTATGTVQWGTSAHNGAAPRHRKCWAHGLQSTVLHLPPVNATESMTLSQYCTALHTMGKEKSDPEGFCTSSC